MYYKIHGHPDAEVELGLDMAVHGEPATAIEAVVNELAVNFQMSFLGRILGRSDCF